MKNPKMTLFYSGKSIDCVELEGFSGYFVDRFNEVVSFRTHKGKTVNPWPAPCGSGVVIDKFNLFDDEGNRRQLSRRKVLTSTLGKEEFQRRENLRENMVEILAGERKAKNIARKKRELESKKVLDEQFRLHHIAMAKEVADLAEAKRKSDETYFADLAKFELKQALGDLF